MTAPAHDDHPAPAPPHVGTPPQEPPTALQEKPPLPPPLPPLQDLEQQQQQQQEGAQGQRDGGEIEYPEGGLKAWSVVLGSYLGMVAVSLTLLTLQPTYLRYTSANAIGT